MRGKQFFIVVVILIVIALNQGVKAAQDYSNSQNDVEIQYEHYNRDSGLKDTLLCDSFIDQEIRYIAPYSDRVYLVWKVENYELENAVNWINDTKLNDGLLYTPMVAQGDTFILHLNLPKGSVLQYYFWITKSKKGHYQDLWDLQSSGKIVVEFDGTIIKDAVYSKKETGRITYITNKSWLILLVIVFIYWIVLKLYKGKINNNERISQFEKVIFTGISFAIFQALARSEILGIYPFNVIHNPVILTKLIKASISDYLYLGYLVIPFLLFFLFVRNHRLSTWIYGMFMFLVIFSTLIAFTNIKTVIYLGKPFNYQWLYYSDFLLSDDSKSAVSANLSLKTVANMVSFCVSMLLLSGILTRINRLLGSQKKVKYIIYSILLLFTIIIGFKSKTANTTWTRGQSENAILCMVQSIIDINSNSSFFTMALPDDMKSFDPKGIVGLDSVSIPKNHRVKNILFVILESAGALYFDDYGGAFNISPNLNRYGAHALTFKTVYAHAPATNRSLVSILGSIYPYLSYKSLTQESPQFEHPTINSVLKEEGYRTSFFSSANLNFQNCREFLSYRSFDQILDFSMIDCGEKFNLDSDNYTEGDGIDDMCLVDCLTSWLDEDTTKNFFSLIWTVQGHYPYFFAGKEEDFGVQDINFNRYLNSLRHNDELLGRVMRELERRELDKSTLVVVVGDHGEAFGQHGQYGHGTALYEENLRIPLYFISGELFSGQKKDDIAALKDLATTSLSIIGVDVPNEWQGRNLVNTVSDESFFFAPWSDYLFGYRKDNMKFVFNESLNQVEVYDLNLDPKEELNLIDQDLYPEVEYARNRVAAWVQYQDAFFKSKLHTIK
ncbi:LTA synthase family protein [Saccharicrinis sp. FJH2]|uniref:LTA synthase family protein n=1 Tax=Saccharicrinis sp. FJH65 TaxID=3344659 RepID=UPI0035F32EBA